MPSTVDYSVSSDEEEHKGLSVAPVIGWQGGAATAPELEEGDKEEQPPAELATATLGQQSQHDEAAMSQVKEPEEEEPRQPMPVPAPSVDLTHTHTHTFSDYLHFVSCAV